MNLNDFEDFKKHVLTQNTYFDVGFANAFRDSKSKLILARVASGEMEVVFPQDIYGSYFYLRNNEGIAHKLSKVQMLDCGSDFDDTITVHLVAVVKDADAYKLMSNLRKTCLGYKKMNIVPVATNWNREQITIDEMSDAKDEDIMAALQRWDNQTVLRMRLEIMKKYIPDTCGIVNPCKDC